jgi:hypothetical protein
MERKKKNGVVIQIRTRALSPDSLLDILFFFSSFSFVSE